MFGLALGLSINAIAQPRSKPISQYVHQIWKTEDGLPQNTVTAMAQTPDGYVWLGTRVGLVRFDGMQFTLFDSKSIPAFKSNYIWTLLADREGSLWIGTQDGGLIRLKNNRFENFSTDDGLPNNYVTCVYEDRQGMIWIGTAGGFCRFDDGKFDVYNSVDGLSYNFVWTICEDKEGSFWIGTDGGGLNRFKDGRFELISTAAGFEESAYILSSYVDRTGQVWFGTGGYGLLRVIDGRLTLYARNPRIANQIIWAICEDRAGEVWIGTDGNGLFKLDQDGELSGLNELQGLSSDLVSSIFEDHEGNIWVGTRGGGLNRFWNGIFSSYTTREGFPQNVVYAVYGDDSGTMWFGTGLGGLVRYRDGIFTSIGQEEGLSHNILLSICEDRTGGLWIGSDGGGLNNYKNGKNTVYTTAHGLSNNTIWALFIDKENTLWIGTDGGGLNRLKNGKFSQVDTSSGMTGNFISSILQDHTSDLWIGTRDRGLYRMRDGVYTRYTTENGLPSQIIWSLYEDRQGDLWIATNDGLCRFKNNKFYAYRQKDGLSESSVFSILEDESDNLWMSSNGGILIVNKRDLDDFDTGKISSIPCRLYGTAEGMKSAECNTGYPSAWKAHDGSFWFPTIRGPVVVSPGAIKRNEFAPPVFIERLSINGTIHDQPLAATVPAGEGKLEFHYTALSYVAPEKVRFRYKLEGYDEQWIDAGDRRAAFYTNLSPGEYQFKVMGCNNDGLWNEEGASIKIALSPPYWKTAWFQFLCVIAVAVLLTSGFKMRVKRVQAQNKRLEQEVRRRTQQLEGQKQDLEMAVAGLNQAQIELEAVNEKLLKANNLKRDFLANMSHEIRTPMNGIIGMNQLLMETELSSEQSEYTEAIRISAESLLIVINDILDISKIEAGKLQIETVEFGLRELFKNAVELFAQKAGEKGLKLLVEIHPAIHDRVIGDPLRLRQILLNYIGNAVKFTERGKVLITAAVDADGENEMVLRVAVKDTGIGIPADKQDVLFQSFSQADTSVSRKYGGSGLGLAISKRLAMLMGGEVGFESSPGAGSTFWFTVSLAKSGKQPAPFARPSDEQLVLKTDAGKVTVVREEDLRKSVEALTVLVAEDNLVNQKVVSKILEKKGYEVLVVSNGADALALASEREVDLILMDVQMPVMDGLEVTRRIRLREIESQSHVPIIALTANAMEGDRERCLAAGMDGYISKPIDPAELLGTIKSFCSEIEAKQ